MSRVIVFGSNGMAGHVVARYLEEQGHEVVRVARDQLDVEKRWQVTDFFSREQSQTDFVVNCIGLLVKDCIDRPDRAVLINSWWPHFLEQQYKDKHTRVIHLSTDCVFDGTTGKYKEKDFPAETNAYGRSKSLGEINNAKDATFRMSIIGPELKNGTGLFNWIYNNPEQELPGWDNAWWNGITTLQLAKIIHQHIVKPRITGVYHVVNNNARINKFGLLYKINDIWNLGKTIKQMAAPKEVDKTLIDTRAEIKFGIGNYDEQLQELHNWYFKPVPIDACDSSNDLNEDHQNSSDTEPVDEPITRDPASQDSQGD